jgi:hypothetical protein
VTGFDVSTLVVDISTLVVDISTLSRNVNLWPPGVRGPDFWLKILSVLISRGYGTLEELVEQLGMPRAKSWIVGNLVHRCIN